MTPEARRRKTLNEQRKIRVAVVFGGQGPEHPVSCMGAGTVLATLDRDSYEVVPVGILPDGRWVLTRDEPERLAINGRTLPSVAAVAGPEAGAEPGPGTEPVPGTEPGAVGEPGAVAERGAGGAAVAPCGVSVCRVTMDIMILCESWDRSASEP